MNIVSGCIFLSNFQIEGRCRQVKINGFGIFKPILVLVFFVFFYICSTVGSWSPVLGRAGCSFNFCSVRNVFEFIPVKFSAD